MTPKQICRNCGAHVEKLYCSNCGQKNNVERLRWATLVDGFVSSFLGDGAFSERRSNVHYGFLMTLWVIITRPGVTVAEYLEGRRRRFYNPVTLLLLLSSFYAIVSVMAGVVDDTYEPSNRAIVLYSNIFWSYCESHPAMLRLLLLPFSALALKWVIGKRSNLRYVEYMYIGIFSAIFGVSLLILRIPFEGIAVLEPAADWVFTLSLGVQMWYAGMVFRQLFGVSWKRAIWYWLFGNLLAWTMGILTVILVASLVFLILYLIDPTALAEKVQHLIGDREAASTIAPQATEALKGIDSLVTSKTTEALKGVDSLKSR